MIPPLTPISRGGDLPLSHAQERIWFLAQIDPDSPTYNMPPVTRRLCGRLEVDALRRAFEALVRRHESLRTVFRSRAGVPFQRVLEPGRRELPVVDLRALGEPEREAELAARVLEQSLRPFELSEGPLLRTLLVRLRDDEHALVIAMHHIGSDFWSLAIFWRELCALYHAFVCGGEPDLPPLPIQYADYASWHRRWMAGAALERELAYWKRQLADAPEEIALPTRGPRPAISSGRAGRVSMSLEPATWARLRALGRSHRASPFMTLLAGFRGLLARYTGQDDVCIGTPVAGRTHHDVRGLIGCFVNTLALRSKVDRAAGFSALLAEERRTLLQAMVHQQAPFEAVVEALGVARSLSRSPLFQVMFALQNLSWEREELSGLGGRPLANAAELAQLDLEVTAVEEGERLQLWFVYKEELFEHAAIEQMARHYLRLLEAVAADPGTPIGKIELLSEDERRRLRVDWGRGAEHPAGDRLVHERVAEQARRRPEAIAVVSGGAAIGYRELDRRANQLAQELHARGVGPDTIVGIFLERSIDFVVATYAVLKAGGAYLPLDPRYPVERLEQFLTGARPPVVVTTKALQGALPGLGRAGERVCLDRDRDRAAIAARPDRTPPVSIHPENLAVLLYTSGSTGRPKGVATPHRGLANFVSWMDRVYEVGPDDRGTQLSSASFDAAVGEVWPLLAAGATVHVVDDDLRLDPAGLWRALERWGITICEMSVSLLEIAMALGAPPACLRILRAASDRLTLRPPEGAGYQLINEYGLTETSVDTTWAVVAPAPASGVTRLPPIGRPLDNLAIRVLDRDLELVPPGVAGELCVAGPSLARGYLGDPAETAARFIPDPFGPPGARMYRSGDQVRWLPDGQLEYLTRIDHQIKVRGFRVELAEIEHVLAGHPAVVQSAVVARRVGEGDKQLVAYVVPAAPGLDLAALRAHVGARLPDYMVPSTFVVLGALPLTANGKVSVAALPAPSLDAADPTDDRAPRSPVEVVIARIWGEILGRERIGVHDEFFALGGHSLLVIRVVAHMRELFAVELPVRRIFETPTVAGLAEWLGQTIGDEQAADEASLLIELYSDERDDPRAPRYEAAHGGG